MIALDAWRSALRGDPVPWLLEQQDPAIRHLGLRELLDEREDAPSVRRARAAAMRVPPISSILDGQERQGYWVKPGSGYGPKYTGTAWSVMFLDQMGADPRDRRIQRACTYVLEYTQAPNGGFGWSNRDGGVVHRLNGDLLRALIDFGLLDDPSIRASPEWQARARSPESGSMATIGGRRPDRDPDVASTGPSRVHGARSRTGGDPAETPNASGPRCDPCRGRSPPLPRPRGHRSPPRTPR